MVNKLLNEPWALPRPADSVGWSSMTSEQPGLIFRAL
jgi:hypothetical protein